MLKIEHIPPYPKIQKLPINVQLAADALATTIQATANADENLSDHKPDPYATMMSCYGCITLSPTSSQTLQTIWNARVFNNRTMLSEIESRLFDIIDLPVKRYNNNVIYLVRLFTEYHRELAGIGVETTRAQNDLLDYIDARSIYHLHTDHCNSARIVSDVTKSYIKQCDAHVKQVGYYAVIPCFKDAKIQLTDRLYVVVHITDIDLDEKQCRYDVQLYHVGDTSGIDIDVLISSFTITVRAATDSDNPANNFVPGIMVLAKPKYQMAELYTKIPAKKIRKWNKNARLTWNNSFVKVAEFMDTYIDKGGVVNAAIPTITGILASTIVGINSTLSANKPKIVRTPGVPKTPSEAIPEFRLEEHNARKVRTVGMISIRSTTYPRASSEETIRRYHVASWNVRGHTRHYKSGKVVYVEPHVSTRKCLNDIKKKSLPAAPSSIIIKQ